MKTIICSGTPYDIGHTHGLEAKTEVLYSLEFYKNFFETTANVSWEKVKTIAAEFIPRYEKKWPHLLEEMKGVAAGSGLELEEIVALNVRTEIAFGLRYDKETDGCTSFCWKVDDKTTFLAQNWDWKPAQQKALIALVVNQTDRPRFKIGTEAGIIGKIGINEHGVGCLMNAIQAKGMDYDRIPIHTALRLVLECKTAQEAITMLKTQGCASAAHILVADAVTAEGLEMSAFDVQPVVYNKQNQIYHSNHYLVPHVAGVTEKAWMDDSTFRCERIEELGKAIKPDFASVQEIFKDEGNFPEAINRQHRNDGKTSTTVFNIVMDLGKKRAVLIEGRPSEPLSEVEFTF